MSTPYNFRVKNGLTVVNGDITIRTGDLLLGNTDILTITSNADNITTGTVAPARLGSGTANSTTVLYGNGAWESIVGGATLVTNSTSNSTFYIPMSNSTSGAWTNGVITTSMTFVPETGTLTLSNLIESSSIRIKENPLPLQYSTPEVLKLEPVSYNKIDSTVKEIGLIAEEVYKIIPEVVKLDDTGAPEGINYARLVVVLVNAIQDLNARVKELENR